MLILKHKVPQALILPEPVADLDTHLEQQQAHWFSALPAHLGFDEETPKAVVRLNSRSSKAVARRTRPNKLNSRLSKNGGVAFEEGTFCGFMLPDLAPDPQNWSCAVRFSAPEDDARTVFTLKPENTDNYIFLHQVAGEVIFKDQSSTQEVTKIDQTTQIPALIVAGMSDNRLWLRVGSGPIATSAQTPLELEGPFTLFIGCRNNKARLQKTLGTFDLHDLVFWPDRNVLSADHGETLEALDDPALWRAGT